MCQEMDENDTIFDYVQNNKYSVWLDVCGFNIPIILRKEKSINITTARNLIEK